jgi:putative oxidoreductase
MNPNIGLLILRGGFGLNMLLAHGMPKLLNFQEKSATFADPIGIGSAASLVLAVGAEVFASVAVVVGWKTKLACIPLVITMVVAAVIQHGDDPWGKKELAVAHLFAFLALAFLGPGRFSLDRG